jgi:hypothetical protein
MRKVGEDVVISARSLATPRKALNTNASPLAPAQQSARAGCFPHSAFIRHCFFTGDFEMRFARLAILALALPAMTGCAADKTADATAWRHSDGSELTAAELAKGRAACRQTASRTESTPAPFAAGNPAYHPGGIGLDSTLAPAGFGAPAPFPNTPRSEFDDTERLTACLASQGIVRAP